MAYLALYRKYRPGSFDDLVGQSEVASIIKNEILHDKLSHAYLFSGPRGTGKTSSAKIIAKMINCHNLGANGVPCGCCDSCLNFNGSSDIVEIDAASNNGVDEIRELRDKVNLVPSFGKYKVYIIDEVHMLTTQAFNALLKTLEEPPSHVIFILATTEFYKIPATVVSRCQKFQFFKFSNDDIVKRLSDIALKENISVDDDVLFEIARLSDGGLRDAINMLDQLSSFKDGKIELQDVYKLNGVVSYEEFRKLLKFVCSNEVIQIINFMDDIDRCGKNFDRFIEDLITFLKDVLIFKRTSSVSSSILEKKDALVEISNLFSEVEVYNFIISLNDLSVRLKNSSFSKILVVTEFIKFSNSLTKNFDKVGDKIVADVEEKIQNNLKGNIDNYIDNKFLLNNVNSLITKNNFAITDKLKKIRINNAFATASKKYKDDLLNKWYLVQEKLSNDTNYVSIAGMMNDIEILVVGEKNIIFLAQYDSLLDRLLEQILLIEQLLFDVFKIDYKIIFLLKDEWLFEKEKYISNLRNGKKYDYIVEDDDLSSDTVLVEDDVNKIVSILGDDVIAYE